MIKCLNVLMSECLNDIVICNELPFLQSCVYSETKETRHCEHRVKACVMA